jgi:hypothetical protein
VKIEYKYIILAILILAGAGGCSRPNRTKTTAQGNDTAASHKVTVEKKDQYRMGENFKDSKTQIIDLIEGPATFDIRYEGNSTFTAKLLNNNGDLIEILVDVTGSYKGTKLITVPKTSSYILDVKTTGTWSVYRK